MASQKEKTDERKALEKLAKDVGVKGIHLFSKEGSLEGAIAKKQAEAVASEPKLEVEAVVEEVAEEVAEKVVEAKASPKRKAPPRMNVAGIGRDDRAEMIERLDREDPECMHSFQNSNITARELAAKGFEKTEYSVRNDIVCRTERASFEKWQQEKIDSQYEDMQAIDGGTGQVDALTEMAKAPRERQTN
jgi:hypothetical protein